MALMPVTDAAFLYAERRDQPMHVGSLQVFQLPEGAGPEWVPQQYRRMLEHRELRPLFRRRPVRSIGTLGAWAWELDDDVDLEHHVRHAALPRPGRVRELLALTSRLHGYLLDRHRPLWEMYVIEGLEGDRFAVYSKIHHALLDGVSGLRLVRDVLTTDPEAEVAPPWVPRRRERPATGGDLAGLVATAEETARDLLGLGPALARLGYGALTSPERPHQPLVPPRTILNVPITGARRYAAQSWPLDRVRAVGRAAGATVNDVVLAMCSSALRAYLSDLDALPETSLVAMTPVSLRARDTRDDHGNAVGAILASLATDVAEPEERLEVIKASMAAGKETMSSLTALQATALSALIMAPLALGATRSLLGVPPQPFNLVISNVPGPQETLYLNGARLTGLYPLSIPVDGQALNVTVTSYAGSLDFGLTGDRRAVPHLQRLLGHLDTGLKELARRYGA